MTAGTRLRIRRADQALAPAIIALVWASVVVAIPLARAGGDVSALIGAGPPWTDPSAVRPGVRPTTAPYDGQFYYRIALDPLTDDRTAHGITLDRPAYRQQRIVYPTLAWLLSGGNADLVPLALLLVNLAGMFAIGWLGGMLARGSGLHALWGVLFPLYPGFVLTVTNDLTEIVAAVPLLAAIIFLRSDRAIPGAMALVVAVLARETTAIFAGAAALTRFVASPRDQRRWWPFLLPGLVLVAWQIALAARWGSITAAEGAESFDPPVLGLLSAAWLNADRLGGLQAVVWSAVIAFVLAMIVLGVRSLRRATFAHERVAWLLYLALLTVLEANIWANAASLRILTELGMLTCVLVLVAPARLRWTFVAMELALAAALAVAVS